MKNKFRKICTIIVKALCVVAILLIIYSILIEPNLLRVYSKDLYLPNFNKEHNGLKIAIVSDFHVLKYGINESKIKKIVEKTNAQNPDFIFILGDIDCKTILKYKIDQNSLIDSFSKYHAKYGVYSVLGNHDYNGDKTIDKLLKKSDITLLKGALAKVKVNGKDIYIYGLDDFWHIAYKKRLIDKTNQNGSIIVLSHNPDAFPFIPPNVSLVLSGHTQVYLPLIGGLFCSSMYKQRFIKGYVVENNKHIYVTSGLGSWMPVRFGNIPEVVILNLYSQDSFPDKKIINTPPKHQLIIIDMVKLYSFYLKVFKNKKINLSD